MIPPLQTLFVFVLLHLVYCSLVSGTPSCTTYTSSILPKSGVFSLDQFEESANVEWVWVQSDSGNIEVKVDVCGEQDKDNEYIFDLDTNKDGHSTFSYKKISEDPTPTPTLTPTPTAYATTSHSFSTTTANTTNPSYQINSARPLSSGSLSILPLALISLALIFFPNSRIGVGVLVVLLAGVYVPNYTRAASSTKLIVHIALPPSVNTVCVGTNCFQKEGLDANFAALDEFNGLTKCNTSNIMRVPDGWVLAEANAVSLLVIYLRDWLTYGVILDNSTAYLNLYDRVKLVDEAFIKHTDYFGDGIHGYQVRYCDYRILIRSVNVTNAGGEELISSPNITEFITFAGYDYAVADNIPQTNTTVGCQTTATYVDSASAWTVAPDDGASRIVSHGVNRISFGTTCIVVASGAAFRSDLSQCDYTSLRRIPFGNGTIYTVDVCDKRILMRRPTRANSTESWKSRTDVINNGYYSNGVLYASLDDVDPRNGSVPDCQQHFLSLPTGWQIATSRQLVDFIAREKWNAFPATYCYVSNGISLDHNNNSCTSKLLSYNVKNTLYYNSDTCGRILIVRAAVKSKNFEIGMKLLLISVGTNHDDEVGLLLAQTMLNATGVPYDWINLLDSNNRTNYPNDLPLVNSTTYMPLYYGIIFTDSQLSYEFAPEQWISALSDEQKGQIASYRFTYNVRLVSMASYPTSKSVDVVDHGLAPLNTYLRIDSTFATQNAALFGGIRTQAVFNITNLYRVSVQIKDSTRVKAVLRYTSNATQATVTSGDVAAAVLTEEDGSQELQFYVGNSVYITHGPVLASFWLNWVTRGIYVGNRRVYLSAQVDDHFLGTEQYNNPNIILRVTSNDMHKLVDFFKKTIVTPAGSNITLEMAFNADGVVFKNGKIDDSLYNASRVLRDNFFWESHTYTHLDLTCPESDCAVYGNTTYLQAYNELKGNINFTINYFYKGAGGLNGTTFSRYSMVTPRITGLFNYRALNAMYDNGIYCAVGDNSRPELVPSNLYHGIHTTKHINGRTGIFIIPRFPTEIYYDCSYPETQVDQYNYRYGPGGIFKGGFTTNSTLDDIMSREAERVARYLIQFRHDPYMFHQANMVHFPYKKKGDKVAKQWSLVTLWIQSVLDEFMSYMTLPVITLKQDHQYILYQGRMSRDACGISAKLQVANNKNITGVVMASTAACEISVTGLASCYNGAKGCRVEKYGSDTTVWAKMNTNVVQLPGVPTTQWIP